MASNKTLPTIIVDLKPRAAALSHVSLAGDYRASATASAAPSVRSTDHGLAMWPIQRSGDGVEVSSPRLGTRREADTHHHHITLRLHQELSASSEPTTTSPSDDGGATDRLGAWSSSSRAAHLHRQFQNASTGGRNNLPHAKLAR